MKRMKKKSQEMEIKSSVHYVLKPHAQSGVRTAIPIRALHGKRDGDEFWTFVMRSYVEVTYELRGIPVFHDN